MKTKDMIKLIKIILAVISIVKIISILFRSRSMTEEEWLRMYERDQKDMYNPYIWEGIDESKVKFNPTTGLYEPLDKDIDPFID